MAILHLKAIHSPSEKARNLLITLLLVMLFLPQEAASSAAGAQKIRARAGVSVGEITAIDAAKRTLRFSVASGVSVGDVEFEVPETARIESLSRGVRLGDIPVPSRATVSYRDENGRKIITLVRLKSSESPK